MVMATPKAEAKSKKCGICKAQVKQSDQGLLCEYCVQWFHITCQNVQEEVYEAISASGDQTHWFCNSCNIKALDTIRFIQCVKEDNEKIRVELTEVKSQISDMSVKFEEKINKTKAEINKKPNKDEVEAMIGMSLSKIKAPDMEEVNKAITEQTDEMREQERRKCNIIIFNAKEQNTNPKSERTRLDTEMFLSVSKTCKADIALDDIEYVDRLGEKNNDESHRPIRIRLKSCDPKKRLFKNLKFLSDAEDAKFQTLKFDHDQTRKQREEYNQLVEKSKQMDAEKPEESPFVYHVRGPPWNRTIKKIDKKK